MSPEPRDRVPPPGESRHRSEDDPEEDYRSRVDLRADGCGERWDRCIAFPDLYDEGTLRGEATSELSDSEVARLFRVIDDLRRAGTTVLYISHKMNEVFTPSKILLGSSVQ